MPERSGHAESRSPEGKGERPARGCGQTRAGWAHRFGCQRDTSLRARIKWNPYYSCPLPFAQAKRDARFKITLTSASLPKDDDRDAKVLFQFFNYTQEMQAAETLGSTLWEADGMEWEFYYEIARHCYDEVRHSALGEARLAQLGHHGSDSPTTRQTTRGGSSTIRCAVTAC